MLNGEDEKRSCACGREKNVVAGVRKFIAEFGMYKYTYGIARDGLYGDPHHTWGKSCWLHDCGEAPNRFTHQDYWH